MLLHDHIHIHRFENGLGLLAEPMDGVESAAFTWLLPAGWRHDPADQVAQLVLAAGRRQCGVAHVVTEVEMRVGDPDRSRQLERYEAHHLAIARHQVELGGDHLHDLGVGRRRGL